MYVKLRRIMHTFAAKLAVCIFLFLVVKGCTVQNRGKQTESDDEDEYNDFSHFHLLSCSGQLHLNVIE